MTKHEIKGEEIHFYFTELNEVPEKFKGYKLYSKGFFQRLLSKIFLFEERVFLHITQRRWLNEDIGKVVTRDW
jgi:hypothetical protein